MSVAVRVIPCLDVKDGRVVKGVNFTGLRDAGDPVELARRYDAQGADEITFLDVSASREGRATMLEVVAAAAEQVFVPLTVGGGVRGVGDVDALLRAGADKVGVNTAAIARPELLSEVAERFGEQVLVLSLDARRCPPGVSTPSGYEVTTHGGTRSTGVDALEWARRAADLGAGEILLNSMDADGVTGGFDLDMLDAVRERVRVPLIASGGAGRAEDFAAAADHGADAVLAASVFHYGTLTVADAKEALRRAGHPVRTAPAAPAARGPLGVRTGKVHAVAVVHVQPPPDRFSLSGPAPVRGRTRTGNTTSAHRTAGLIAQKPDVIHHRGGFCPPVQTGGRIRRANRMPKCV